FEAERRHVLVAQQSAVRLRELVDLVGDFAAVEVIAHGVDRLRAAGAGGERFLLYGGHRAQGPGQIGLAEHLPRLPDAAVRQENAARARPGFEVLDAAGERVDSQLVEREAVGQLYGRLDGLGK